MEINKNLSIVIPTYNRADFLDYSLEVYIPMLKEYGIEIAIFDNASTDNTYEIVSKWIKEYDYLTYHKNETLSMVEHRASTIKECTNTIELKNGQIQGIFKYNDLKDNNDRS